jgi:muramidase (phage lysozyme)
MRLREETSTWKAQNPEFARGLLSAIAWAEGTRTKDGKIGYDIMFGGNKFNDFSRHPDTVNRTPGYASAAAGAYQFMPKTWEMISKELGLNDFSPESQDIAALALAKKRLPGGLNSINKAGGLTPELLAKLAPEWASFPTLAGKSYYGQPVKSYDAVNKAFLEGKNNAGAGAVGTMQTPTTLALNHW